MVNIIDIISGKENDTFLIPNKKSNSKTGTEFIQSIANVNRTVRQQYILDELLSGNVPDFFRKFSPVTVKNGTDSIVYLVSSDFLCIGTNQDYVRIPMQPYTAQKIADQYDCTLPTRKMVNDIWKASPNKLQPLPWGPPYDSSMMNVDRIAIHNSRIQNQLTNKDYTNLTSGHKKDVVLTNKLSPNNPNKRVAIYGWIQPNGVAIQGPGVQASVHEDTYEDIVMV
jgi:hypothetical protein